MLSNKRTLEAYFSSSSTSSKKARQNDVEPTPDVSTTASHHHEYPFPIADLPPSLTRQILSLPASEGKCVNDKPDLDLLYFEPYLAPNSARDLFEFLRSNLPFYRVEYKIKRGSVETQIRTPRWTTVFGLDETSKFNENGFAVDKTSETRLSDRRYEKYPPRPIPNCLDELRKSVEKVTAHKFNFCLVNYYASGADSISFHSDDERFLGKDPSIASISLGARRDFLMKHKSGLPSRQPHETSAISTGSLKIPLGSGDMVLMRGKTQSQWLHSIPKRTGKNQADGERINITFRKAMVKDGTQNYYNYNVGDSPVYRWSKEARQMTLWNGGPQGIKSNVGSYEPNQSS